MWQPIETAPKDGSSILLATPKGRIADGFWALTYGVWSWPYVMVEPTHWMPLPVKPSAQAQPTPSVPREAINKMLTQLMDIAVSNGANSVSMPDEYVEVAAWLCGIPAQPAPSVPDGWLRAIDESLVVANIGVANPDDTYEQAKAKLDNLIGFHVDVATDPAVNGGFKLMPAVSTYEMDNAGASHCDGYLSVAAAVWDAMFVAAPETKS